MSKPTNLSDYQVLTFDKEHELTLRLHQVTDEDLKSLWQDTLTSGLHGLGFSMYEPGQRPGDIIPKEQVERRLSIIQPYTQWVRSFSCIEGNEHVPRAAKKMNMKTMVGAWLGDDKEKNAKEMDALIDLCKEGVVDIAAIGNEVLYRDDLSLEELLGYMQTFKQEVSHIPMGYVDAYYEFSRHPELVEHSDVILSNCYPFWEKTSIDHAVGHMDAMIEQVLSVAKGKPVIVTETGWPSEGTPLGGAEPSAQNAMRYFIATQQWAKQKEMPVFYFSSFDEAWKQGPEGDVGGYWGLWTADNQLKF